MSERIVKEAEKKSHFDMNSLILFENMLHFFVKEDNHKFWLTKFVEEKYFPIRIHGYGQNKELTSPLSIS